MSNKSAKHTKGAFGGTRKYNGIKLTQVGTAKNTPTAIGKRRVKEMRKMGFRKK
jgi:hypothetical protein